MSSQAGMESALRAAVAERVGEDRFGLWFGEGVRLGVDGDSLQVGVPNAYFRDWIKGHFAGNLADAAEAVTGPPPAPGLPRRRRGRAAGRPRHPHPPARRQPPTGRHSPRPLRQARERRPPCPIRIAPGARRGREGAWKISSSATGNRLAHAAATEAAQSAGAVLQPPGHPRRGRPRQDAPPRRHRDRLAGQAAGHEGRPPDGRGVHQRLPGGDAHRHASPPSAPDTARSTPSWWTTSTSWRRSGRRRTSSSTPSTPWSATGPWSSWSATSTPG